ncbi:MAG: flagellar hook assembly protein FlgD [Aestuariivirga sp.]
MDVPAINSPTPATITSASAGDKAKLNYDSFLRLLVAEMKNQDPTAPKDTSQYLAQLASFSAVEQGVNTNKKLDSLMTSMQLAQADSLIGHTLTGADGFLLGTIKSVEIGKTVSTAILEGGKRVELNAGVTIG